MLTRRVFCGTLALFLVVVLAGCRRVQMAVSKLPSHSASEERTLTAAHVPGSGIEVRTGVGSIDLLVDPSTKEVEVIAKVSASGDTDEEAKARLQEIKINVNRRDDRVLEVTMEHPKEPPAARGGCSFVIHVPEAQGIKAQTGIGSVTLKGLAGLANAETGIGSITVNDHKGDVIAHTGNGLIQVARASGKVEAKSSIGSVKVNGASGDVTVESGNGSLEVDQVEANVRAKTSIGPVKVRDAAGDVTAETGNGTVEVRKAKGAVQAHAQIGSITVRETAGRVKAESGNGSITLVPATDSRSPFELGTSIGGIKVQLPDSVTGTIQAQIGIGSITVNGRRQPHAISGDKNSKRIVLTETGPPSQVKTGNGSITITLD